MKNEEMKFKKFLSKYTKFKEEMLTTNKYLIQIQSFFNEQIKQIDYLIKKLNEQNKFLINEEKINNKYNKDQIYTVIKLINETFETMISTDKGMITELLSNVTKIIDNIKKENKKYDSELEALYNLIKEEKEKMEIQKKLFYESTSEAETNILNKIGDIFENKGNANLESLEISKEPKNNYINYKNSIEKINETIKEFNNKEKLIIEKEDNMNNNFNELLTNILNHFHENQIIKNNLTNKNINIIKEMIIINNNKILNDKPKINIPNKNGLDLIEFENYPSNINFIHISNNKEYQQAICTIEFLKGKIGDIYPNFSIEKENRRNDLREKIRKLIYDDNNIILEEDKKELFDILKKNEENQNLFLSLLNKLRIHGRYKRSKEIIDLIGSCLNIILDKSSITKNYENAKVCMILSQTFFYKDDNNEKIYICELIKNNGWIQKEEFWRNYIDLIIVKELMKLQQRLEDKNINIFMKNNIPTKISNKTEELLFAQLVPCINNMVQFNVDKKITVKVIEEFIHKYDYLGKKNIDTIYNFLSNDKDEIKKLKENYKKNIKNLNKNKINEDINTKLTNEKKDEKNNIVIPIEKDQNINIKNEKNEENEKNEKKEEQNKIIESNEIIESNKIIESNEIIDSNKIIISNEKEQDNKFSESSEKIDK